MQHKPTVKKVPADSVPYGTDICTRGNSVWAAYSGEELIAVGATAKEARAKYTRAMLGKLRPSYVMTEGRRDRPHTVEPGEPLGVESDTEYARRIKGSG